MGPPEEGAVPRRLTRDTQRAVLGGVAAGFGRYLDVDPVLARLGFVLLAFVNGLGILFYLACWLLMPRGDAVAPAEAPASATAGTGFETLREAGAQLAAEVRQGVPDPAAAQLAIGSLLVVIGSLLLAPQPRLAALAALDAVRHPLAAPARGARRRPRPEVPAARVGLTPSGPGRVGPRAEGPEEGRPAVAFPRETRRARWP